jgi:succinoglycan biosynthesis transport protein ExoP
MSDESSVNRHGNQMLPFTLRDLVAVGFRRRQVMALCFVGVFLGVLLSALFLPSTYRAETKILVKRERLDPVVSPEQNAPMMFRDSVSEEDLNSEVELIESEDVVVDCGLDHKKSLLSWIGLGQTNEQRTAKAVDRLKSELGVEPVKKSNVISVSYESKNPQLAYQVLTTLNQVYIQKHLEAHHPTGQVQFFEQETEQYRKALEDAEQRLKTFDDELGGVAPAMMRDLTLQKLAEFNSSLQSTRAQIQEAEKRIQDLGAQQKLTPSRMTTQVKKGDNPQVLEQLKGTMMTLELKRTELLTKYQPTYPLVVEVDKEITDTRAALAKEEGLPLNEETTDQNPTYAWINSELSKAKADLGGLQARETATQAIVNLYATNAKALDEKGLAQQDLLRTQKANEETYLLYRKKQEEARIADALDQSNILNIVVAQVPVVPALPSRSPWLFGFIGLVLAAAASLSAALILEYLDSSFRTPAEVVAELGIPVLASVPRHGYGANGNGSGNGNGNGNGSHSSEQPLRDQAVQSVRVL